jgi:hypothetical protein
VRGKYVMEVSMRLPWLVVALVGLAACDGKVLDVGGDDGSPGQSPGVATDSGSSATDATLASDARGLDATLSTDTTMFGFGDGSYPSDSAHNDSAPPQEAAVSGMPIDAGLYYADGSFFVDGGAYPDTGAPADAAVDSSLTTTSDAAPGCSALAACCPSLSQANASLCNAVVGLGNGANCSSELAQLQAAGECTGVSILASEIQVPPNLLVSDGTLLFWTTTSTPGLLAMPARGGPITIVLNEPISNCFTCGPFLAVDAVNVYVLMNNQLVRIPKRGGAATLVNEPAATLAGVTSLGGVAYWAEWAPGALLVKSVPLLGGTISSVATFAGSGPAFTVGPIGVTSSALFFPTVDGGLLDSPQSGTPALVPQFSVGAMTSITSDTNAVYCAVSSGPNLSVSSGGTTTPLGSAINSSYITFDDTYVYWADQIAVGSIMKAPKAGGSATVVAWDTSPAAIAVDANSVYWSDADGYIKSIAK